MAHAAYVYQWACYSVNSSTNLYNFWSLPNTAYVLSLYGAGNHRHGVLWSTLADLRELNGEPHIWNSIGSHFRIPHRKLFLMRQFWCGLEKICAKMSKKILWKLFLKFWKKLKNLSVGTSYTWCTGLISDTNVGSLT